MIRNAMGMCDKSGQFLFQVLPNLFPHGHLTLTEMMLWEKYYKEKEERRNQGDA